MPNLELWVDSYLSLHEVFKGSEVLEQVWLDGVEKQVKGFG